MSDDPADLVKVAGGGLGGGALLLWLVQRVLGRSMDDAEKAKEAERAALVAEVSALRTGLQDVSNKLSILLDRDTQRQRRDDAVDGHLRDLDRRMGSLEAQAAASAATIQQLREGGR